MTTYRNTNTEGDLFEKARRYIGGLGFVWSGYKK